MVTGTFLIPNVAHLALLGSCWSASPGVDAVPYSEDSLWHENESRVAIFTDTVSLCELLRGFSQPPCGAADPAGFVAHPRRAPPAVLSGDSKRRVQLPFLPVQLLPRALFTCQKKVDFFFPSEFLPGSAIWVSQHPPPADVLSCLAERCSRRGAALRDAGYQYLRASRC